MSLKAKLSLTFSLIVTVILILNTALSYYSTKNLLQEKYRNQMDLLVKSIAISVENSQYGSKYIENLVGHELRTASIAAKYALNPNVNEVSNNDLIRLSKELDVSHITLLAKKDNDIVGIKSSDPKEIGMGTKEWGYWYDAFQQLVNTRQVQIPEGQKLPNYWSGPINISSSDSRYVDKWGYFYDGTTDYIIDPYIRAGSLQEFQENTGPERVIKQMILDNPGFLEITGFNPKEFKENVQVQKSKDNLSFTPLDKRPILFGNYKYKLDSRDESAVKKALAKDKIVSFEANVNKTHVIKSCIPVRAENPYVIGIVIDYKMIKDVLNQQIKSNLLISIFLLLLVFGFSYLISGYLVRPVLQIINKVKEISEGHFGVHIQNKRQDELGLLATGVNKMSSNLANYQSQLEYQAYYDALTDLPNRRLFQEELDLSIEESKQNGKSFALMFFDLDRFKFVNDIMGHTVGDILLKSVGERATELLEEKGQIYRIGGDEFTIILQDITREEVELMAQKLISKLTAPFMIKGYEVFVTPSIGISMYPDHCDDAECLLKNTDVAMYRAKELGKNSYQFYLPEINESFSRRVQLEKDLHKAVENKELILHYQPQVDTKKGNMTGVEALVRWQHPEFGIIPPAEFIPIAEETGLIIPIGEWVLYTACNQMKTWHNSGFPLLRVAVNLSARQFQQGNLAETVEKVIKETGIDPNYLELEITEGMAMKDSNYTIIKLQQLEQLGVQVSMDDFGTGYSSLNYLRKFPINKLKVDKSFVDDISVDQDNEIMIKTIITMAHNLKLSVIAEGVEKEEQVKFLKDNNCDEIQGYFYSKPISPEQFEAHFQFLKEAAATEDE